MYPLPPNERTGRPHIYVEAFCLMKYQAEDGTSEILWNSRDGVTPFVIRLKPGADGVALEAKHVEWNRDQYLPNFVPEVGSRIFVDLTPARAREFAERNYDEWSKQDPQFTQQHPDREAFVASSALGMLEDFWPNTPSVVEVTEEIRKQFVRPVPTGRSPRFA
jgi:hypothetical protein